jgi:glycerol-3-phosphate dehydrogenase (NAD(P)+)
MHSRNRRCGMLIGKGMPPGDAVAQIGATVEGFAAAKAAYKLSQKLGVEMPITSEVYYVLYEGKKVGQTVRDLMERPKRHESEAVWLLSR